MQNLRTSANKGSNDAYDVSVSSQFFRRRSWVGVKKPTPDQFGTETKVAYRNLPNDAGDGGVPNENEINELKNKVEIVWRNSMLPTH